MRRLHEAGCSGVAPFTQVRLVWAPGDGSPTMFTVMTAFSRTPERSGVPAPGPVFVDNSGRRLRRARVTGLVTLVLVTGYVLLFLLALFGGPNIVAPYLPQPAAAPRAEKPAPSNPPSSPPQPPGADAGPGAGAAGAGAAGAGAVPVGQAVPAAPVASAAPAASAGPDAPAAPVRPRPKTQPAQAFSSAVQANPAATPRAADHGPAPQAPADPGKSALAPGQTSRPTPPPHP
jgi:hypothetical protein